MGISSIVTAALPIPITLARFIPIYSFQTKFFSVFTSLFCFLLLAYIFYRRHALAPVLFPHLRQHTQKLYKRAAQGTVSRLPALLILGCLASVVGYVTTLMLSVKFLLDVENSFEPFTDVLQLADQAVVPIQFQILLFVFYLGIFLCAMGAFVLMAIKEFLQDTLGITERDLLTSEGDTTPPEVTLTNPLDGAVDVPPDIHPTATFSKDMDGKTINPDTFKLLDVVTLKQVPPKQVPSQTYWRGFGISYDGSTRMATFPTTAPLQDGRIYMATITAGVKDQAGNTLAQDHTWHFTVISS
jgi:Big-like domain-containing protein